MKEIYLIVQPELPCNGCNRPGKAAVVWPDKLNNTYTLDITCRECALYLLKVYNGETTFGEGLNEPVAVPPQGYSNDIQVSESLECTVCGASTDRAVVMRMDTELPHNFKCYPYCPTHADQVKQRVG